MARDFDTNPLLLKELAEGENIVWKGAPETFPLMSEENKGGLTRRWICCIVAAVAVVAVFIAFQFSERDDLNLWVLIIALIAIVYFALLPLVDRNNIYKKCRYYITDRRVIVHYGDRDIFALPRTGLRSEIISAEDGCVHVLLGSCIGLSGKKRRVSAFVPKKDENDNICGMVLYNVEDSAALRQLF